MDLCIINNDLIEGDSAFCQPKETLLTEVQADMLGPYIQVLVVKFIINLITS